MLNKIMSGDLLLVDESQNPRSSGFYYSFQNPETDGKGRTRFDSQSMSGF
jgi:hypothetical protein